MAPLNYFLVYIIVYITTMNENSDGAHWIMIYGFDNPR